MNPNPKIFSNALWLTRSIACGQTLRLATVILLAGIPAFGQSTHIQPIKDSGDDYQKPNALRVYAGTFFIPKTSNANGPIDQVGFQYSRRVNKSLHAIVRYSRWFSPFASGIGEENLRVYEERSYHVTPNYVPVPGQLESRVRYQMIDLGIRARIFSFGRRNSISAGLAMSYCYGTNVHLDYYVQTPWDAYASYYSRRAGYWGIAPSIAYERTFFNGRASAGAEFMYRHYPHRVKSQRDLNLSIGLHF